MIDKEALNKAATYLREIQPLAKGPTHWSIDDSGNGWMIVFSGPVHGFMHPKSFCEMIIEMLNKESQ